MGRWRGTRDYLRLVTIVVALSSATSAQQRGGVQPQRKAAPVPQPAVQNQTLAVTVLPFRQSVGSSETTNLGAGISDSVSNALKAVANVIVTDGDIVVQAAA